MTDQQAVRPLKKMFMSVPPSYDLLNRLLTFGFDELWRKRAAKKLLTDNPGRVLDICTGTGDLALRLRKAAKAGTEVAALDYSPPMLEEALRKARKRGLSGIKFVEGDVANLPFTTAYFDAIGIAFAFRNLTYKNPDTAKFLTEILRVLKPGGRFVVVETTQPVNCFMRWLIHIYLKYVTVPIGGWISGHRGAYHYLAHSAINYHNPEEVKSLLADAGFKQVEYTLFLTGVAGLWVCLK
jgi:demethylmenaquinone methyltransferase / 2-methoxy-6-polyprenyl-1,4-benzoquinol methylase